MTESARQALALAAVIALLDCLWLIPIHPDAARLIVATNAAVAGVAAIGSIALATIGRRRPEVLVFALLAVTDAAILSLGFLNSRLGLVALAYLLLLPTIVALLIPWASRIHIAWLGLHGIAVLAYALFAPSETLPSRPGNGLVGVIGLLALISGVSQLGQVNSLRARVQSFVQIQRIRALNREARRAQVRLDHLNRVLAETARTDELTGLDNRLSLKLDLAAIRSRIARNDERYGLLMLDFDRFKEVNDRLGHIAGDEVLRVAARSLARAVRAEDAVYRYGGEELLVLTRVSRATQAMAAGERLRLLVEGLGLPHPGNPPWGRVTMSVGVTVVGREDLSLNDADWMGRADAALYRAKAHGRNRCEGDFVGLIGAAARASILDSDSPRVQAPNRTGQDVHRHVAEQHPAVGVARPAGLEPTTFRSAT